ncbi:MAG: LytTR family DNA-binding domain-containing protein [Oscillospiraceae bacterium]
MILRALIVDDEYPARQELRYLLSQFENVEIVGEAAGATEALKLIDAVEYDILFLDINLTGMNGLEFTEKLNSRKHRPHIIFITAYENFALDAFRVNATDYILKPIEVARLKQAIDKVAELKAVEKRNQNKASESTQVSENNMPKNESESVERVMAEAFGRFILVDVNDICYAFTEGDHVYLKTATEKIMTRFTLKELEEKLNSKVFYRTHRSFIVNIRRVKEIQPFFNGTYSLTMDDKEKSQIPVSRSNAQKLRKMFGRSTQEN